MKRRLPPHLLDRCGLEYVAVEADSGAMGGSQSQEFMVYTEAGEDLIASSRLRLRRQPRKSDEQASPPSKTCEPTGDGLPELVQTPGKASEPSQTVTAFFGIHASQDIKCVAFMGELTVHLAGEPLRPIVAFLRGDHQVNETKLNAAAGTAELRPMLPEELAVHIGGPAGFLGPVGIAEMMTGGSLNGLKSGKPIEKLKGVLREDGQGLKTIVIMDLGLEGRKNLVAGANQLDFHFRNVTPGRDFTATLTTDIRDVLPGEADPIAGEPLRLGKAVEIGHIFKLGYKYSKAMGASVLGQDGKAVTPIMGSYGIGVERILTAAIETSAAKSNGESYALPAAIAPFQVIVTITNIHEAPLLEAGEKLAADLTRAGFDVLLDDRDERAGVKFKDADLTGVPYRIAVGKKLAEGKVELLDRLQNQTADVELADVAQRLSSLVR